jgi:aspartate kinase
MKVIKFGGTSQSVIGYKKLVEIINQTILTDEKLVIVLSAVSGVTNLLEKFLETKEKKYIDEVILKNIKFVDELNKEFPSNKIFIDYIFKLLFTFVSDYETNNNVYLKAKIIGYGEIISTHILYQLVQNLSDKKKIILGNSYDYIKSSKETSKLYPCVEFYCSDDILLYLKNNQILITQGFIASTPSSKTIILGRGGSDTTGALIANKLDATEYQVWTDVNGIFSADPNWIINAKLMNEVNYEIVQEMAGMGAKVMHPYSILPCKQKNIPIKIFNTFNNNEKNTIINNSNEKVFCVTSQKNVTLFKITSLCMWNGYGFVYDIFKIFSDKKININIITTSQFSISTTTDEKDNNILKEVFEDLSEKYQVEMTNNNSIVSLVTNNLEELDKYIYLPKIEYEIIHYSPNHLTKSYVVHEDKTNNIIRIIHDQIIKN